MIVQVLGVAAAVWLFVATWQVWILGFVALIIAAAILPAARAGERWHVPRGLVVLGNPMRLTTGVVGAVFELLAVLVIAAYLVIDTREIGHTLLALLPREHRATATRLAPAVRNRIGGYVRGQIVASFVVGGLIALAPALPGVQDALLLGPPPPGRRLGGRRRPLGRAAPRPRGAGRVAPGRRARGTAESCSTTQVDDGLRLWTGTDSQPDPPQHPNHGSRATRPRPARAGPDRA